MLRLPFRTLTKESIAHHENELKVLEQRIAELNAAKPADLWIADLDAWKNKKA